jgi:hypothetical protein
MKETLNPRLCEGRILVEPHLGQISWLRSVSLSARTTVLPSEYTSRVNTALDRRLPQPGLISRRLRWVTWRASLNLRSRFEAPSSVMSKFNRSEFSSISSRARRNAFHSARISIVESVTRACSSGMFWCLQSRAARELRSAAGCGRAGRIVLVETVLFHERHNRFAAADTDSAVDRERTAADESEGEFRFVLFDRCRTF